LYGVLKARNGNFFDCTLVVDSAADHCIFPLSYANNLVLDPTQMKQGRTRGIGNSENVAFFDTIRITINQDLDFEVYAGFTAGADNLGVGLLGQAGFFSEFLVSFAHFAGQFHIQTRDQP
jgi:hypothetical protein